MKLVITGDVALARGIDKRIGQGDHNILDKEALSLFEDKDICLINLECPITDSTEPGWNHFPTLKAGTRTFSVLQSLNVDVASLANNHIKDYGDKGLSDTVSILETNGIAWCGAGKTPKEANAPVVIKKNGCSVGILALAQKEIAAVGRKRSGAGLLREKTAIRAIRELSRVSDTTIAYLHFGPEFFEYPTPDQIRLSRALVDAGANLVIGHHPHVVQGYEYYKGGFIAYSLGNFMFDMKPVGNTSSRIGMIVKADMDKKQIRDIQTIFLETAHGRTVMLDGEEKHKAEEYVRDLSSVIMDRSRLIEKYYFTCRDHFKTYMGAFIYFLFVKRNLRNCYDWIFQEFWPQILKMRIDLIRFVISGQALDYEVKKGPPQEGMSARVWRNICLAGKTLGFFGGRFLKIV